MSRSTPITVFLLRVIKIMLYDIAQHPFKVRSCLFFEIKNLTKDTPVNGIIILVQFFHYPVLEHRKRLHTRSHYKLIFSTIVRYAQLFLTDTIDRTGKEIERH